MKRRLVMLEAIDSCQDSHGKQMRGQTCMFQGGCGSSHRESVADVVQGFRLPSRRDGRAEMCVVVHDCKRHEALSMPYDNWKTPDEPRLTVLLFRAFVSGNDRVRVAVNQVVVVNGLISFATIGQVTGVECLTIFPGVCCCQSSRKIRTNPTLPVVSYYRCRSTASKLRRCAQNPMAEA